MDSFIYIYFFFYQQITQQNIVNDKKKILNKIEKYTF